VTFTLATNDVFCLPLKKKNKTNFVQTINSEANNFNDYSLHRNYFRIVNNHRINATTIFPANSLGLMLKVGRKDRFRFNVIAKPKGIGIRFIIQR
jgi:hypothetical protein